MPADCTESSLEVTERRQQIILAALACFAERGYALTTLADIRQRAKASTGSIYHHFKNKDHLAASVYLEGILHWQCGFTETLEHHRRARHGILSAVSYHLCWITAHPHWARYLFQMRHAEFMALTKDAFRAANKQFFARVCRWFEQHQMTGELARLPPELLLPLLIGPSQELGRQLITGRLDLDLDFAAKTLGEAAWRTLRARGK